MLCASVVPYRVRIVIPESEMWESGTERPDYVFRNMDGAIIDFIIIQVARESGFAVASRRQALRACGKRSGNQSPHRDPGQEA